MLAVRASFALRRQAGASSVAVVRTALSSTRSTPVIQQQQQQQQSRSFAADTVYKFGISPEHMETVKATLPLVGAAGTDFTKHFYSRLFAAHPDLQNVFNQTNQAIGGQPKKLLKTVALAAQSAIDTGELPGEAIEGICQKHAALGIGKEAYGIVGAHLLGTIEDLLTDDKAVLEAWGDLYGDISNVFVTREEEIAAVNATVPGSWAGRRKFELVKKEELSSLITRFKFQPVDGQPTPEFAPEQPRHYTLAMPRDGHMNNHMSISVKKEGLVSRMLHNAEVGTQYELSAPFGCFNMLGVEKMWLEDLDVPVVYLSAGVGITPVLAMLENIYTTRPATWLHSSKNGDTHAYRDRIREIAAVRAGELVRRVWYEDPMETDGLPGGCEKSPHMFNVAKYHYNGFMNLEDPAVSENDQVLHLDNPNARYFMCGPPGFMDAQRKSLNNLGVEEERIHSEGFGMVL